MCTCLRCWGSFSSVSVHSPQRGEVALTGCVVGSQDPPTPPTSWVQCDQSSLWIFISLSRSITAVVQAFGWLYTVWSVDTFSGLVATTAFETVRCWIENWIFRVFFVLGSLFADPIEKLSRPEWRHLWGHVTHLTPGESYEEVKK